MMNYKIANKVKILLREITAILLSWDDVFLIENQENEKVVYKLQIDEKFDGWKTIYWGSKTSKKVDNLGVCTLYKFKLCFITPNFTSEWITFRAGTDCGPYLIMHMTRALKISNTSMIRKLAQVRPALLDLENKELKTPLIQVIEANDFEMTKFLMKMGANVNTQTLINKRTPLMVSLFKGNTNIASILVDKGANLNATDINLLTAMHYAVDSNIIASVKFGVKSGCDINAKDNKGWTPLLRTVILQGDIQIIEYLLKHGADITIKDNNGFDFYKHCQLASDKYKNYLKSIDEERESRNVSSQISEYNA